jgi:acetyl-CoA/propionyl-CoA carboxylase biotin carboxyl carrier protein
VITDFKRVLIANRGEIALRIVRACRDASLTSIAVYAEPDEGAPFARLADKALPLSEAVTSLFAETVRPRLRNLTGRAGDPGRER